MDHVPYADQFNIPPVQVPYLGKYEYDHDDFATFPQRTDLCKEDGTLNRDRPISQVAAMAQAWLYFGLLETYNGQPLEKSAVISKTAPYILDSKVIPVILADVTRRMRRNSIGKHKESLLLLQQNLSIASNAIAKIDIFENGSLLQEDVLTSAAVFLSIRILLHTLDVHFHVTSWPFRDSEMKPKNHRAVLDYDQILPPSLSACYLVERMQQADWCPRQISQLLQSSNHCTGYYFSSIRRQEPSNISHNNCALKLCKAYNTDQDTYITRHEGHCRCTEFVEIPFKELESIIQDGDIPLVRIRKPRQVKPLELELVRLTPRSNYTAISHVWIDGLGNPKANSLPRCQLEKLYRNLTALERCRAPLSSHMWMAVGAESAPLFWMDTLCIPVKPHDDLKKMQIDRMAFIYASAREVLVLDEELSVVDHTSERSELWNARIVSSKWNTRCWTLQEGALARHCFYQFRDAALRTSSSPESRLARFCNHAARGMRSPLWTLKCFWYLFRNTPYPLSWRWWSDSLFRPYTSTTLGQLTAQLREDLCSAAHASIQSDLIMADEHRLRYSPAALWALLLSQPKKFARTWSNVGKRSTTMATDIHVIVANLTGFRVSQIMDELPTSVERTKAMLYCIGEFPLDILFNDYRRDNEAKDSTDRWIPSCPGPQPLMSEVKLHWDSWKGKGVMVENSERFPHLFLVNGGSIHSRFYFIAQYETSELWYLVNCHRPANDMLPRNSAQTVCLLLPKLDHAGSGAHTGRGACLIVNEEAEHGAEQETDEDAEEQEAAQGETGGANEKFVALYDCRLTFAISTTSPTEEQLVATPVLAAKKTFRELVIEQNIDPSTRDTFATRAMFHTSPAEHRRTWIIYSRRMLLGVFLAGLFEIVLMMGNVNLAFLLSQAVREGRDEPIRRIAPLFALLNIVFFVVGGYFGWRHLQVRAYREWKASFDVGLSGKGGGRQHPGLMRRVLGALRGRRAVAMETDASSGELQPLLGAT